MANINTSKKKRITRKTINAELQNLVGFFDILIQIDLEQKRKTEVAKYTKE